MEERKAPIMTPDEVAIDLRQVGVRVTAEHIRAGIKQGVYPFGIFIQMASPVYEIYRKDYETWKETHLILKERNKT